MVSSAHVVTHTLQASCQRQGHHTETHSPTTIQDHADTVEVYSGTKVIPNGNNRGFWNGTGLSVLQSTTAQANYLTNNENLVDYVDDTYVDIDYA